MEPLIPLLGKLTTGLMAFLGGMAGGVVQNMAAERLNDFIDRWFNRFINGRLQEAMRDTFRVAIGDAFDTFKGTEGWKRLSADEREMLEERVRMLKAPEMVEALLPRVADPEADFADALGVPFSREAVVRFFAQARESREAVNRRLMAALEPYLEELPPFFIATLRQHLLDGLTYHFFRTIVRDESLRDDLFQAREDMATASRILDALGKLDACVRYQGEVLDVLARLEVKVEKVEVGVEELLERVRPELPVGPPRPPRLDITVFGQEALKRALFDEIVEGRTVALTALRGLPGVGKTTLALWLANQPQIVKAFPDGVLWASLGEDPDVSAELGRWLVDLGLDPTLLKELPDAEARSRRLRTMLDGKECLLVVDDVWQVEHAHPFLKARGDRCAVLVTGRSGKVMADLVGPDRVRRVDPLEDNPALDMLREHAGREAFEGLRAGTDPETGLDATLALVRHLGNLPLALKLAGAEVRRRHRAGLEPAALLPALRAEERRLLTLKAPEARVLHPEELSLEAVIRISYDALPDDDTRRAFRLLAVFGPKPLDFGLPAILSVWGYNEEQAEPLLMALADAELIEVSGQALTSTPLRGRGEGPRYA
ncbi:MAG: NB-ARC domain-containing protein, partial [Anaerolineae bacterium]